MAVNCTITLGESQYNWLIETVEYEIDYFEKLGTDRTEDDNEQLQRLQALQTQLEMSTQRN